MPFEIYTRYMYQIWAYLYRYHLYRTYTMRVMTSGSRGKQDEGWQSAPGCGS